VTVREIVLERDVRAPLFLRPASLLSRYYVRRTVSVLALMAFDVLAVVIAALAAPALWRWLGISIYRPTGWVIALAAVLVVVVAAGTSLYGVRPLRRSGARVLKAGAITLLVLVLGLSFSNHMHDAPSAFLLWLPAMLFVLLLRAGYDLFVSAVIGPGADARSAIIIGRADYCQRASKMLAVPSEFRLLGAVADAPLPAGWQKQTGLTCLGVIDHLESIIARTSPAQVVIADPDMVRGRMQQIIDLCRLRHVTLKLVATDIEFGAARVTYVPGFGLPLFVVKPHPISAAGFVAKRVIDVTLSLLGLLVLSPLLLAIALIIKVTSPGPVFFGDMRIGLGERPFRCHKFRTMFLDAADRQQALEEHNECSGALFKIRNDPRVTPIGRVLRRLSMDELPQLWNIIKGDMSLVGPRPLPLRDNARMHDWQRRRHVVLPGLTGPWQASGRSDLDFDEMIRLDFRYLEDWSLTSDLVVMLRTIAAVLTARGAS
jgi:exopolysaccharide biosynthesis polyprenyl glycosylphosphotransferase